MAIRLADLLEQIPDDAEERVKRAKDRINSSLRDAMRRETGLLLNRRDTTRPDAWQQDSVSVPVKLAPGVPTELANLEFPEEYRLAVLVGPFRTALTQGEIGLKGLQQLIGVLLREEGGHNLMRGRETNIAPTRALIEDLLALVNRGDPVKKILAVNKDVLGRYIFRVPVRSSNDPFDGRIELYWGIIALIAGMLGVTIESLTVVVLAHELGHAYTHLGADIDGERWSSQSFANSDHELVEGLAQYYTHLVGRRLGSQIEGVYTTYQQLLERQPPAYQTHVPWTQDFSPEEVRFATLEVRRQDGSGVEQFNRSLDVARRRLRSYGQDSEE